MTAPWIVLFVALWLAVLLSLVLAMGLSRRIHKLESAGGATGQLSADDMLPASVSVGGELPIVAEGGQQLLAAVDAAKAGGVLLFLSTTCGPCLQLAEQLRGDISDVAEDLSSVALIVVSDPDGPQTYRGEPFADIVVDERRGIYDAMGIRATPAAIAVDQDRVVRGVKIPQSAADVATLARSCAAPTAAIT